MKPQEDPREAKLSLALSLLVMVGFAAAVWLNYMQPTVYTVVIYDVWKAEHPGDFTDVYTRGQGIFSFYGYHPFEADHSYRIIYVEQPTHMNRLACKLLSMEEISFG